MVTKTIANPNDAIRQHILEYFYDRNTSATSRFGKRGSFVKISDVKRDLCERFGLSQAEVMSNLNYLLDKGWVKATEIEKTIQAKGGSVPSTVTWFSISSEGIDKMEGDSEFQRSERWSGINIQANGSIVTLGDGNIVHASHAKLHGSLDQLKRAVEESATLDQQSKVDIAADLETIKDQLVKEHPDKTVLQRLWTGIEKVVTGAEFAGLATTVGMGIAALA